MRLAIDPTVLAALAVGDEGAQPLKSVFEEGELLVGWPGLLRVKAAVSRSTNLSVDGFIAAILRQPNVKMVSFAERHYQHAAFALDQFGKGTHEAAFTLSDCLTYGLAAAEQAPVLSIGRRFHLSDIETHPASIT